MELLDIQDVSKDILEFFFFLNYIIIGSCYFLFKYIYKLYWF